MTKPKLNGSRQHEAKPDAASARTLIEEDKARRGKLVEQGIQTLLKEHRCTLDATVTISASRIIPQITVLPLE